MSHSRQKNKHVKTLLSVISLSKTEEAKIKPESAEQLHQAVMLYEDMQQITKMPERFLAHTYDELKFASTKAKKGSLCMVRIADAPALLQLIIHLYRIGASLDYLEELEENNKTNTDSTLYNVTLATEKSKFKRKLAINLKKGAEEFVQQVNKAKLQFQTLQPLFLKKHIDHLFKQHRNQFLAQIQKIKKFKDSLKNANMAELEKLRKIKQDLMEFFQQQNPLYAYEQQDTANSPYFILAPLEEDLLIQNVVTMFTALKSDINKTRIGFPEPCDLESLPLFESNKDNIQLNLALTVLCSAEAKEKWTPEKIKSAVQAHKTTGELLTSWITGSSFLDNLQKYALDLLAQWKRTDNFSVQARMERIKKMQLETEEFRRGKAAEMRLVVYMELLERIEKSKKQLNSLEIQVNEVYAEFCNYCNQKIRGLYKHKYSDKQKWAKLSNKMMSTKHDLQAINISAVIQHQNHHLLLSHPSMRPVVAKANFINKQAEKHGVHAALLIPLGIVGCIFGGPPGWLLGGLALANGIIEFLSYLRLKCKAISLVDNALKTKNITPTEPKNNEVFSNNTHQIQQQINANTPSDLMRQNSVVNLNLSTGTTSSKKPDNLNLSTNRSSKFSWSRTRARNSEEFNPVKYRA